MITSTINDCASGIRVPSLVLIAEAVFLLERGQTDRQTDATERYTHAGGYADVGNSNKWSKNFYEMPHAMLSPLATANGFVRR